MKKLNAEILLIGNYSTHYLDIKTSLEEYLRQIKLPLKITELIQAQGVKVAYQGNEFIFNERKNDIVKKELFEFLMKVNPKTGKICKCKDCGNCPSKRIIEDISAKSGSVIDASS